MHVADFAYFKLYVYSTYLIYSKHTLYAEIVFVNDRNDKLWRGGTIRISHRKNSTHFEILKFEDIQPRFRIAVTTFHLCLPCFSTEYQC
jgi:hypothetical protein